MILSHLFYRRSKSYWLIENSIQLYINSIWRFFYVHWDLWYSLLLVLQVLKVVRKEVLKGCKIVFSRVFPATRYQDANHHLWKMAEQLGATCMTELDPSVTCDFNRCWNREVPLGTERKSFRPSTVDRSCEFFVAQATWRDLPCQTYK